MGFSLSKRFRLCATAALSGMMMAGLALLPGDDGDAEATARDSGGMCVAASQAISFDTDAQRDLERVLDLAQRTPTGARLLGTLGTENTTICMEPALAEPNSCGNVTIGRFYGARNRIGLNPEYNDPVWVKTVVHEARHKEQRLNDLHSYHDGNYREAERLIMKWLTEADARVATVLFAYEMQEIGHPEYMAVLNDDGWYRHIVQAFTSHLDDHPEDMTGAMREGIYAFREHTRLRQNYDNNMANWIEGNGREFDPSQPADVMVTDERLAAIGEMGDYGSYMTPELADYIRSSVTDEYYRDLHEARMANRRASGNMTGPTCS